MKFTMGDQLAAALRALLDAPTDEHAKNVARMTLADFDAMRARQANERKKLVRETLPFRIGDHCFVNSFSAYKAAQALGYNGSHPNFSARVKKGLSWEECCKPVDAKRQLARRNARDMRVRAQRDEMAKVIEALDARKKTL